MPKPDARYVSVRKIESTQFFDTRSSARPSSVIRVPPRPRYTSRVAPFRFCKPVSVILVFCSDRNLSSCSVSRWRRPPSVVWSILQLQVLERVNPRSRSIPASVIHVWPSRLRYSSRENPLRRSRSESASRRPTATGVVKKSIPTIPRAMPAPALRAPQRCASSVILIFIPYPSTPLTDRLNGITLRPRPMQSARQPTHRDSHSDRQEHERSKGELKTPPFTRHTSIHVPISHA